MATGRRLVLLASAGAVTIAALVTGMLWLGHQGSSSQDRSSAATRALSKQADQVAVALRKLPANPQALVATGARSQVAGRARQAFPSGTMVMPDARS